MCESMKRLKARIAPHQACAEKIMLPLVLLAARLKIASVFLMSGWLKLGYVLGHQLGSLYAMFEVYNVPLLPPHLLAWLTMGGELLFGVSLALGICARLGALGIVIMSAVIYYTDQNPLAIYWALLCLLIALMGPGKWSLDSLLCGKKTDV